MHPAAAGAIAATVWGLQEPLDRRPEVRLQLETVLAQEEGLRDISAYQAILTAVANGGKNGRLSRSEVAAALGFGGVAGFDAGAAPPDAAGTARR